MDYHIYDALTFFHITDTGSQGGHGTDSTMRILDQYEHLGLNAKIISAGHCPLSIAFTGSTKLQPSARKNADKLLYAIGREPKKLLPRALNCAPRNADKKQENGKENHIFWYIPHDDTEREFLIYGEEVVRFVHFFHGHKGELYKISSIKDIIPDTSCGSQFRSAEHLPLAQLLASIGKLKEYAEIEEVTNMEEFTIQSGQGLILPPDEFKNSRIVIRKKDHEKLIENKSAIIPSISNQKLSVEISLTNVTPGVSSLWKSSNAFPDEELVVMNIGTRWKQGTTDTTDSQAIQIAEKTSNMIGQTVTVEY